MLGFLLLLGNILIWNHSSVAADCVYSGQDLGPLYWQDSVSLNGFIYSSGSKDDTITFKMCEANAITIASNTGSLVIGRKDSVQPLSGDSGGFKFSGELCPGNAAVNFSTSVNFRCGKTLGRPRLLHSSDDGCNRVFDWTTTAVCKNEVPKSQIMCYGVDRNGKTRDFSPLIQENPWPVLGTFSNEQLFVSVCQSSENAGMTPALSAGVYNVDKSSSKVTVFGKYSEKSHFLTSLLNSGTGFLHLESNNTDDADCPQGRKASIVFMCPTSGQISGPMVTEQPHSCERTIEWKTEYACPMEQRSSHNCSLTLPSGYVVDLSSLKGVKDYSDTKYIYSVGLCGSKVPSCGGSSDGSACQKSKTSSSSGGTKLGVGDGDLRYVDNLLTLTYSGGKHCRDSYARTTTVQFVCDSDERGITSVAEDDCSYTFEWKTPLACIHDSSVDRCYAQDGSNAVALYPLTKNESNWEVLLGAKATMRIFINLCHDVVRVGDAASCPEGSSVCSKALMGDEILSRGSHMKSLTYSQGVTTVHYIGGSTYHTREHYETVLTLICQPGNWDSSPDVIGGSATERILLLEWHTAAACSLQRQTGAEDCKLQDSLTGLDFDLNHLRGQHKLSSGSGTYYINICGSPVQGISGCETSSVCQLSASNESTSLGAESRKLEFYGGTLSMAFSNGTQDKSSSIEFVCDQQIVGSGNPTLLPGANKFEWRTPYACGGITPSQCVVTNDAGYHFDLSRLSRTAAEGDWILKFNVTVGATTRLNVTLNVCRPAHSCMKSAGTCSEAYNMGKPSVPIINGHNPVLLYENGDACDLPKKLYSTKVFLFCDTGSLDNPPEFLSYDRDMCRFNYKWSTAAACPIKATSSNDCSIVDHTTGLLYNLTSLEYQGTSTSPLKMNVCGTLAGCGSVSDDVAVCYNGEVYGLQSKSTLRLLTSEGVQMEYDTNNDARKTIVNFECDRLGTPGSFVPSAFNNGSGDTLRVIYPTDRVCGPAKSIDCKPAYGGVTYDFTPLTRTSDNWVVENGGGEVYYLNVCGMLNRTAGSSASSCPGGGVSACMSGNGVYKSLGYMSEDIVRSEDGQFTLRYTDGQECKVDGGKSIRYTTLIKFYCSAIQESPVYVGEVNCVKTFQWNTPSACSNPVNATSLGTCGVMLNSEEFNVEALNMSSYTVQDTSDYSVTYSLKLCSTDHAAGCTGNVCRMPGGLSLGSITEGLTFDPSSSRFQLKYSEGGQIKSVVTFKCSDNVGPASATSVNGIVNIEFNTPLVCRDEAIDCHYRYWDFSSLALRDRNYIAIGTNHGEKVFLNSCKRIVKTDATKNCPGNSVVCKLDSKGRAVSLGAVNTSPVRAIGDHFVSLQYSNGDVCEEDRTLRYRTTFVMLCDENDQNSNPPRWEGFSEPCHYMFHWHTKAACNDSVQSSFIGHDCIIPGNVDFRSLNNTYSVKGTNKLSGTAYDFSLKICGGNQDIGCQNTDAGGCQKGSTNINIGKANNRIYLYGGNVRMEFTGGDRCRAKPGEKEGTPRSTVIDFVCSRDQRGPVYAQEIDCSYSFLFFTPLACMKEASCFVGPADNRIDLSPLRSKSHYLVVDEDNPSLHRSFFLNLCQPVMSGVCPPGSSACVVDEHGTAMSLGQMTSRPVYNPSVDSWDLLYSTYPKTNHRVLSNCTSVSSLIKLECGESSAKSPSGIEFLGVKEDGCRYEFLWKTMAVCVNTVPVGNTQLCEVTDPVTRSTISLLPLKKLDGGYSAEGKVEFNICGPLSLRGGCNGSAVCIGGSTSYGMASNSELTIISGKIKLAYKDNKPCSGRLGTPRHTVITFVCDETKQFSASVVTHSECFLDLEISTRAACPYLVSNCSLTYGTEDVDLSFLSKKYDPWTYVDSSDGRIYDINLCSDLTPHGRSSPSHCEKGAVVCSYTPLGIPSTSSTTLGLQSSQSVFYSSAREGVVTVEYSKQANKALVQLKCGPSFGSPKLRSKYGGTVGASYTFQWDSLVICPEDMGTAATGETSICNDRVCFPDVHQLFNQVFIAQDKKYKYYLSLSESLNSTFVSLDCAHGKSAACQVPVGTTQGDKAYFERPLGYSAKRQFHIYNDSWIAANFTYDDSAKQCGSTHYNVYATVHLRCNATATKPWLRVLYESNRCDYVFELHSTSSCQISSKSQGPASPGSSSAGSPGLGSAATAGLVVGLICLILAVVAGVFVYRKKARASLYQSLTMGGISEGYGSNEDDENILRADGDDTILSVNPSSTSSRYRASGYDSDVDLIL